MNKSQLVDCIQAKLGEGATKKCAETALNAVLDAIKDAARTEKVQLVGFGSFEMKARAARTGRNPQTGAPIEIAASQTLSFKASASLRSAAPAKKTCKKGGCKKK